MTSPLVLLITRINTGVVGEILTNYDVRRRSSVGEGPSKIRGRHLRHSWIVAHWANSGRTP
jgi:hypothetical protein